MKLKRTNKLLALLIAAVMVLGVLPMGAWATESGQNETSLFPEENFFWPSPKEVSAYPMEGSLVSCVNGSIPVEYGEAYYIAANCVDVVLSGIEKDACVSIAVKPRDHNFNDLYATVSSVGFTWETEITDELIESIIYDLNVHYSEEDDEYIYEVQFVDGKAQLVVFYYYGYSIYEIEPECDTPWPLIMNFYTEEADNPNEILMQLSPSCGQLENENSLYGGERTTYLIVPNNVETVDVTLTFSDNVFAVSVNGEAQGEITDNNKLTVTLNAAQKTYKGMAESSENTISVTKGEETTTYKVYVVNQRFDDLPNSVIEYLCIGSQYTNDASGAGDYGTRAVRSLVGSNYSVGGIASGPVSIGNFGGYIIYKYDEPIMDDPNNPYGIDFITFGNSVEGSNEFGEVGQVWVSKDGEEWYALAGGMHYEDYADWDYSVTYSKQDDGATAWADNRGNSGKYFFDYPDPNYYPYYDFSDGGDSSITLGGIYYPESSTDIGGNDIPPFAGFGYTDMGQRGTTLNEKTGEWGPTSPGGPSDEESYESYARNIAGNPYNPTQVESDGRTYSYVTDGMDLAWAVDEDGQPVSFENGVHYIKIQTATNIVSESLGEKSTEVNMVRVAQANDAPVGKTAAPAKITVDGVDVALEDGKFVYDDVLVCDSFSVAVDAPETANVYINNLNDQTHNRDYDAIPLHKIVRVIVQEGEQEPAIYILNLTDVDGEPAPAKAAEALIADIGEVTLESKAKIDAARAAYDALDDAQKALVSNYETLTEAEAAYAALAAAAEQAEIDAAAAKGAENLINAIGEVTLQSETAINAARAAYDALTDTQKALVTNNETLTAAEARLAELIAAAASLTLDANGGTVNGSATYTYHFDASMAGNPLPDPVAPDDSVVFGGWFMGQMKFTTFPREVNNTVLVAEWIPKELIPAEKTIDVSFRLIGSTVSTGDVDLADGDYKGAEYVTWIPTTRYTVPEDATIADLFLLATQRAGIRSVGADKGYVSTVYAPSGYALSEFTNGPRSGWMYTMDGVHTNAINTQTMHDGAEIVFHYVNDYAWEVEDWSTLGGSGWPQQSTADKNFWNAWLKALDTTGSSSGAMAGDSGSDKKDDKQTGEAAALPAEELKTAADSGKPMAVETENGTVTLPSDAVKALAASGKEVEVAVKDNGDGTTTVSVTADGKAVDAGVKLALPARDGQVLVIVQPDGTEEVVKTSVTADGKVIAEIPAGATVRVADATPMTFDDVKPADWFAGAVDFVTSRGIFRGTDKGFEPGAPMSRAMLVTVLQRISGEKATGANPFGDVDPAAWYADAAVWAAENGIVNGRGDGFAPDANVTREEIAVMLYRFVKYLGLDVSGAVTLDGFADGGDTADWAKDAMRWAVGAGLFRGDAAGRLNPTGNANRAEVATLVQRLVELIVK